MKFIDISHMMIYNVSDAKCVGQLIFTEEFIVANNTQENNAPELDLTEVVKVRREKLAELECFERSGECYLANKLMENNKE